LPVHCRDTCELNSNDCVAKPRCLEEEDNELSVGDSSKSKVSAEDSVVERDRDDSFLSDPNLISVRFPPSPSCSQFSVLISSRHVSDRRRAKSLSNGSRIVCISTSLDARVCGALIASCQWDNFRENFIGAAVEEDRVSERNNSSDLILLFVGLRWPSILPLDAAFGRRVLRLLHDRLDLEIAMAWLSTLGGGFSALGDYYSAAAEKAQKISVAQMKLARDMGDPIVAAKAWVWFSLSLLQKGQLKTAKWIVRKQLTFSRTKMGSIDPRLKNMCKGVLSRIKYLGRGDECEEDVIN